MIGVACRMAARLTQGLTFASIDAGAYHTCGVTPPGAVYCWGHNADGELGTGSTTDSAVPVRVFSL